MSHILDDLDFFTECIDKGQWFMIWKQNWAKLFEHRPEWIKYFPKDLWEEEQWRAAIKALPELAAECPFELKEDGSINDVKVFAWDSAGKDEKVEYVIKHPEYYERLCQEEELEVFDRFQIFDAHPVLAENYDWSNIQYWSIHHCNRGMIGFYWSFLLRSNPQFTQYCPCLQDLEPDVQGVILQYKPELLDANTVKWNDFYSEDWKNLLLKQPQFAEKCDWGKFEEKDLRAILQAYPDLIEQADSDCFTADIWLDVILKKPEYIKKCPENMLPLVDWSALLLEHPDLYQYFPAEKYRKWSEVAAVKSDYLDDCPWQELSAYELEQILQIYPEYIDQVPLRKLSGNNWVELLFEHPRTAHRCPWGKLAGENWVRLILWDKKFVELCKWEKLTGRDWEYLISNIPQYFKKCPKNKLKKWDWVRLMIMQPQLGKHCPYWNTFNADHWRGILKYHCDHAWRCPKRMRPKLAEEWFWKAADQWHIDHDK